MNTQKHQEQMHFHSSQIKYPIFQQCSQIEQDVFFKQLFENLSKGIAPRNITISEKGIYKFKKGCKNPKLLVDSNQSVEQVIAQSKQVLPKVLGIGIEELKPEEYIPPEKFSTIRKKAVREILILQSISKLKMPFQEKRFLFKKCLSLLQLDMLSVVYENGCVKRMTQKENCSKKQEKTQCPLPNSLLMSNFYRRDWK